MIPALLLALSLILGGFLSASSPTSVHATSVTGGGPGAPAASSVTGGGPG
jgi:hypothetical protein